MSARKKCLHLCEHVNHFFSRILCIVLILGQVHYLDYLLVFYSQSPYWWFILIPDWVAIILFLAHFTKSYRHFVRAPQNQEVSYGFHSKPDPIPCRDGHDKTHFPWWPLAWLLYSITISIKIIVLFTLTPEETVELWEAKTLRGATGMQTAVGITSVIFFLMLVSNIHRSVNGKMKSFIHEVGATVTIDLLDTMDLLELLYEEEEKQDRWGSSEEFIFRLVLAIVVINMLVPVFPCSIIHRGRTHTSHMFRRLVLIQKILQIVLVNLLFMCVRLILWSLFGEKFSAFIIKNVLMIGILSTDIFNVYMEAHEEKRKEKHQKKYYETIMGVSSPVKTKGVNGESVEFEMKEASQQIIITADLNVRSTQKCNAKTTFDKINQIFSRFFCLSLLIGQSHYLDYILISYTQLKLWWMIFIPDWLSIITFFIYHSKSYKHITTEQGIPSRAQKQQNGLNPGTNKGRRIFWCWLRVNPRVYFPWGPVAWFIYGTVTSAKIITIFTSKDYGQKWSSGSYSMTGVQLMIGLTSIIFFLLLISGIHRSVKSQMKSFIHDVSATVTIDLLDTMDLLGVIFVMEKEKEEESLRWNGHKQVIISTILAIVTINMLVPVFPCLIIHRGWTHNDWMFRCLVLVQKILQIILVNLFFACIRLILWWIFEESFSAFIIKNLLMIGIFISDIINVCSESSWHEKEGDKSSLESEAFDCKRLLEKPEIRHQKFVVWKEKNSDSKDKKDLVNSEMESTKRKVSFV